MFMKRFPKAVLGLVALGLMVCAAAVAADRNPMALRILDNGTIMLGGSDGSAGFFVTAYSPSGAMVSQVDVAFPFPLTKMAINSDGTVAVGAISTVTKGDIWVRKYYGSNGFPIWLFPAVIHGTGNGPQTLSNLGFDAQGNVFVSGATLNSANNYDFVTLKLDSLTGVRHWVQEEQTAFQGNDVPTAMAFNEDQDVQITGKMWDGADYDFMTLCYAGSTGLKEWPPAVFDSGPATLDVPTAMAVDRWDHITVTGYSSKDSKSVYSTLQYECKTGALRWGPVSFGDLGENIPTAVGLDRHGNVFVSGYSVDTVGRNTFVTLKYHRTTGRLLWSASYKALYGSYPVGLAVDADGDLAVTGMMTTQFANTNYVIMKYDGKTGALLWGPFLYHGKALGNDVPIGIAVDASGNFVVTGVVPTPLGNRPQTVKYDGVTGNRLWIR